MTAPVPGQPAPSITRWEVTGPLTRWSVGGPLEVGERIELIPLAALEAMTAERDDLRARYEAMKTMERFAHEVLDEAGVPRYNDDDLPPTQRVDERIRELLQRDAAEAKLDALRATLTSDAAQDEMFRTVRVVEGTSIEAGYGPLSREDAILTALTAALSAALGTEEEGR